MTNKQTYALEAMKILLESGEVERIGIERMDIVLDNIAKMSWCLASKMCENEPVESEATTQEAAKESTKLVKGCVYRLFEDQEISDGSVCKKNGEVIFVEMHGDMPVVKGAGRLQFYTPKDNLRPL